MKLSDKALLVQLSISQWTARKYDKKVTMDVASAHGADMSVGRYNKSLLPMNDYLDHVHKKSTHIRTKFYNNTLPWGMDGMQILPSANYLTFMTDFRKEANDWKQLVDNFMQAYPQLKLDAQRLLPNGLYKDDDYPTENELRRKFNIDLAVFPVPDGDFRTTLAEDEIAGIRADIERRVTEASGAAMNEVWKRLFDKVQNIAEKLADPSAIFRDSMIENAREICALLPRLNFADDPNLEALRQEVEGKLASHHPDALRCDPDLRRDTAAEAKAIMDKMATFMGGI